MPAIFRHLRPRMFSFLFRKKKTAPAHTPESPAQDNPERVDETAPATDSVPESVSDSGHPEAGPASHTAGAPAPGLEPEPARESAPEPVSEPVSRASPEPADTLIASAASEVASQAEAEILPAPEAAPAPASWRDRLRNSAFARGFSALFSRQPKLDEDFLDELETCLLTADVGVTATTLIVEDLRQRMARNEFSDARGLLQALRGELIALLLPVAEPLNIYTGAKPFVILTVGVNGVGKTTTIGKLARRYLDERKQIMLAAGDTFRAAAVEQLRTWGERNGVTVMAQANGADPAAVIFDALQAAKARGIDLLIADTAGRLHTQQGLMDELGKVRRVLGKIDPQAPHEVLQVIDGTTGQNAINQVRQFQKAANVSGLIVTKLDGSAKGGVIFALAREFGLPIRYIGLGEGVHDLRAFDPHAFVDALLPESLVER